MPGLHGSCARGARILAIGLVAAALAAAPLQAAGADPYRDVSRALGEGLLALFPAVEGYVVSASGGEAYVDLAHKDLVSPGMELQIYRPGDDMVHPVTKQVLGAYEKDLGILSVTEVRESYSRGALDAAGAAAGIVAGDRVRLSARRLRTLLHVAGAAPGIEVGPLAQALLGRGEQSGRFAMIDEPDWAPSLAALGAPWETVRADPAAVAPSRGGDVGGPAAVGPDRTGPHPPCRGRGAVAAHRDAAGGIERALAGAGFCRRPAAGPAAAPRLPRLRHRPRRRPVRSPPPRRQPSRPARLPPPRRGTPTSTSCAIWPHPRDPWLPATFSARGGSRCC